ncbi:MAG: hypothetical protein ABW022_27265 [Actinoplanes sp.]
MAATGETRRDAARAFTEIGRAKSTPIARCPRCSVGILQLDDHPVCGGCGARWGSGAEAALEYAEDVLGLNWYEVASSGGQVPTEDCPHCGETAVVWDGFASVVTVPRGLCFACGEVCNSHCQRCGVAIMVASDDADMCENCWNDVLAD